MFIRLGSAIGPVCSYEGPFHSRAFTSTPQAWIGSMMRLQPDARQELLVLQYLGTTYFLNGPSPASFLFRVFFKLSLQFLQQIKSKICPSGQSAGIRTQIFRTCVSSNNHQTRAPVFNLFLLRRVQLLACSTLDLKA